MGGTALGFESVRLPAERYHSIANQLKSLFLDEVTEHSRPKVIPSYRNKESFGDMDLIYRSDMISVERISNILCTYYTVRAEVRNGPVTSFGIELREGIFQLDFIATTKEEFNFAYSYFSWNDLGNLLGRVSRSIGLKFGHKGLFYVQRDGDYVMKEHLLTLDFDVALKHMGFDPAVFNSGFNTLEGMFEYVMSSRFYDFNRFDLTQRNHKSRIRDAKRPNYHAFLEYAQLHKKELRIAYPAETYNHYHFAKFPEFKRDYENVVECFIKDRLYKEKVNGDLVMQITGLQGKELGAFMTDIKTFLTRDVVLKTEQEKIYAAITLLNNVRQLLVVS